MKTETLDNIRHRTRIRDDDLVEIEIEGAITRAPYGVLRRYRAPGERHAWMFHDVRFNAQTIGHMSEAKALQALDAKFG